jgi:MoxR-like ATPase
LDRFLFKIIVPYPNEPEEFEILRQFNEMGNTDVMAVVDSVLSAQRIIGIRKQVKTILIEEKLLQFIAKLTHQTRNHKSIYLGASPRASLAIMNASKAMAAINGRDFVTPEDILEVVPPVLRHRIILSPDKEMEGIAEDNVLKQIIQTMDIPR